jgi:replicative DNA helicase
MLLDRIPPNNLEAERAIIGIMLQYANKIPFIMDKLRTEMFYKTDNQKIYQAVMDLWTANKPVDQITVKAELSKTDFRNFESYAIECIDSVPSGESWSQYCELVIECYKKREIILHGASLIKSAQDGTPAAEIIDSFSDRMIKLQTNKDSDSLVNKIHELNDSIDLKQDNNYLIGIPSGIDDLDDMTCGWQAKNLIIIGARPSKGKTSLAINCMREALKLGKKVGFFSLEMSDIQIVARIIAQESGTNVKSLINSTIKFNQTEFEKYSRAQSVVSKYITRLYFDEYSRTVTEMRSKAMMWKMRNGLDLIVVDFLQLMKIPEKGTVSDGFEYITVQMKALSKDLDVPLILLSQLNRSSERENREPELFDLRSSGGIEQAADQIIFIHSKEQEAYTDTFLLLKKNRNGQTGKLQVEFKKESALFKGYGQKTPF